MPTPKFSVEKTQGTFLKESQTGQLVPDSAPKDNLLSYTVLNKPVYKVQDLYVTKDELSLLKLDTRTNEVCVLLGNEIPFPHPAFNYQMVRHSKGSPQRVVTSVLTDIKLIHKDVNQPAL